MVESRHKELFGQGMKSPGGQHFSDDSEVKSAKMIGLGHELLQCVQYTV